MPPISQGQEQIEENGPSDVIVEMPAHEAESQNDGQNLTESNNKNVDKIRYNIISIYIIYIARQIC